jgi:hypothetical protein
MGSAVGTWKRALDKLDMVTALMSDSDQCYLLKKKPEAIENVILPTQEEEIRGLLVQETFSWN